MTGLSSEMPAEARTSAVPGAAERCLERVEWQRVLFAERPRRLDLLRLRPSWPRRPLRIRVHRNQPFEFVASAMVPFLSYAGFEAAFEFGPYDDSLSAFESGAAGTAAGTEPPADVEVVWLDFARYGVPGDPETVGWLAGRLERLRAATTAPILVTNDPRGDEAATVALAERLSHIPGVHVADVAAVARELGDAYRDDRAAMTGSTLGDAGAIEVGRLLASRWISGLVAARLKAIVVDLDNTLYAGVLGEDGVAGVRLADDHRALQARLVELASTGILLAAVTRNEPEDVERLFDERADFPLRREHLGAVVASWAPKAEGIASAIAGFRIAPDAVLFLDDNPGELAQAAAALRDLWPVSALDAARALRALRWHPGLAAIRVGREDGLRAADLAAEARRQELAATAAPGEYLRSLEVRLRFALGDHRQIGRMHELSVKTNQFNMAFGRLGEAELATRLGDPAAFVVTGSLGDRLTDSGIVALVCGRRDGATVVVDEIAVSCRALGRGVEDAMIGEAIGGAVARRWPDAGPGERLLVEFREGPRNGPAREWLERLAGGPILGGSVELDWQRLAAAAAAVAKDVTIEWSESE